MACSSKRQFSGTPTVTERVDDFIAALEERSAHMVAMVEARYPGGPFSWPKVFHMREMAEEALPLGKMLNLNQEECHLFRALCRAHDVGRHAEALLQTRDILRPNNTHADLSVSLLQRWHLDRCLLPSEWHDLKLAVAAHDKLALPKDMPSRAFRICAALRDSDKLEILENPDRTLSKRGVLQQASLLFARDEALFKKLAPELVFAELEKLMPEAGLYDPAQFFEQLSGERPVDRLLKKLFFSPPHPEAEACYARQQLVPKAVMRGSYSTALLGICALRFDVMYPFFRELLARQPRERPFYRYVAFCRACY